MKNIYSFWGRNPGFYKTASFVTFLGRERKLRKKVIDKLDLKPGDKVLDLCCGTGLNFPYLLEKVGKGGEIIGFDLSKEMLFAAEKAIKQNKWNNIKLIRGDATRLSLAKASFDGILSTLGLSTIPDHEKAMMKAKEVLKLNKKMVVLDAESFSGVWRLLNPLIKYSYKKWADWDYKKNIIYTFSNAFPKFSKEEFNLGTIYILTGLKCNTS